MKNNSKFGLLISGGLLAALVAPLCCIGPLILTALGVSGAAVLSKLHGIFYPAIIFIIIMFGISGFNLYKRQESCKPGSLCANPRQLRNLKRLYWGGVLVAILLITSPHWVVWIFN